MTDVQTPHMIRQGDVLLVRVGDAEPVESPVQQAIVAAGEATGHHHRLLADAIGLRGDGVYDLPTGGRIVHEEHGPHTLPPGRYQYRPQQVWTPIGFSRVRD